VRSSSFTRLADRLHEIARPIESSIDDFQPLVDLIVSSRARFVLIGEASHGTHEARRG
jgi:erythromycin esterase-like protein